MDKRKREKLAAAGWKVGTVQELLNLSDSDALLVEIRVALAAAVRARRTRGRVSQAELAERMGSSQPRVVRLEQGEGTLDLLVRALLAMGATPREIGRTLGTAARPLAQRKARTRHPKSAA